MPTARPEVVASAPAYHGAFDFAELAARRLSPDDVIDFSVNGNPFGPSPRVAGALAAAPIDRYPDRECLALRRAIAEHMNMAADHIVAGNGASELIAMLSLAFVQRGDAVLIVEPTFGEYARWARLMGANVCTWRAAEAAGFAVDPATVANVLRELRPRLCYLCRPNNPTGDIVPLDGIAAMADASPETVVVVDEAYLAFAPGAASCLSIGRPNIVALRSMTKDYALAGLRLGYVAAEPYIAQALAQVRPAWNVNALAQAAGVAALADQAYLDRTMHDLRLAAADLWSGLRHIGYSPLPSAVHFSLVHVADGAAFRERLLRHGLLVRDCASFGLPQHVRIAARRPQQNQRLLAVLSKEHS